ncbi:MAG TPA: hypothetical protein VIM41_04405 [Gammaproteobacteria bacterium]
MKSNYLAHLLAVLTVLFGVWLIIKNSDDSTNDAGHGTQSQSTAQTASVIIPQPPAGSQQGDFLPTVQPRADKVSARAASPATTRRVDEELQNAADPHAVISDYILAWRKADRPALDRLWVAISRCDPCLLLLADMMLNKTLEEGMMLELAVKMAALDSDVVLPVFDALIDPAGNRNVAIILSEKLMQNGGPEQVSRLLEIIYKLQQNGHEKFAKELTWVVSKLENPAGLQPVLDVISGRADPGSGFAEHVSTVFSKVVHNVPEPETVATLLVNYFQTANTQEQQRLWELISNHEETLVMLAVGAHQDRRQYDMEKYASAIAQLPDPRAVDGLLKLHTHIDHAPPYLGTLLAENIKTNPSTTVLHKVEDYMRDPNVPVDSRIFAAEGLLTVSTNRQARYILEKVVNNSRSNDSQLQAYISGRL